MKYIQIPIYFQELHGEKASVASIILVYTNALFFAVLISYMILPMGLPLWKCVLLFVIVADIAGGAIANFSTSTRLFYRENVRLQVPFLLLHITHPVLLFVLMIIRI